MPVLVTCKFDKPIKNDKGAIMSTTFSPVISIWEKFSAFKGAVNPKYSDLVGNWPHPKFYACPCYLQVWWRSDKKMKVLSCPQFFSNAQGQVTPKLIAGSCWNSNSYKILCLSLLPASLILMQWKMKALRHPHHFLYYKSVGKNFGHSSANNSEANSPIWPKIKLVRDLMPVLVTCNLTKIW